MQLAEAIAGASFPRSDAEVLLARILGRDRSWILAHPEYTLTKPEWMLWSNWSQRRRTHEPVAYILGEQEFYGRPFTVDSRVLIPRPSTEGIVRGALSFLTQPEEKEERVDDGIVVITRTFNKPTSAAAASDSPRLMIDIGTGCGCIPVTLAQEQPELRFIATDISSDALTIAEENAKRHNVGRHIEFRQGNLLEPIADVQESFLLLSNPPYIPRGRKLMRDVIDFEPHVALFGGDDGNALAHAIMTAAQQHPYCLGLVLECGSDVLQYPQS